MRRRSNYAAGRRKEWEAKKYYEKRGYDCTRAAGSKGLRDLVCCDRGGCKYVQVKYTRDGGWVDENWRKLMELKKSGALPPCVEIVAVVFTFGVAKPEIFHGGW